MSEPITLTAPKPITAPVKTSPTVPEGYKIVKVRKPDGTIVKVRRPIAKISEASATTSPKAVEKKPEKPSSTPPPKSDEKNAEAPSPPSNQNQNQTSVKSASSVPSKIPAIESSELKTSKPDAAKSPAPPLAPASKLDTTVKSYNVFRSVRRVGRHASKLASAFDLDSDIGDLEDGDEYMESDSESDEDDSDDSDQEKRNNQSQRSPATGVVHKGPPTKVTVGNGAAQAKVPSATKQASPIVAVTEISEEKSFSADSNSNGRVKEWLDLKNLEGANAPTQHTKSPGRSLDWTTLIAWAVILFLPFLFIGLAIATACLKGKPEDSYYAGAMYHATKFGITAWPIIFAGILAQTLKACATYRVERGIRLLTLEQFISSHSVASALKQPFILRRINWVTIGLLALWGLSPLGSQAMQYTTNTVAKDVYKSTKVFYLNTMQENLALEQDPRDQETSIKKNYSDSMAVLYAAVFQPQSLYQPGGSDPWGNALVPRFDQVAASPSATEDADGRIYVNDAIYGHGLDSFDYTSSDPEFYDRWYSSYYGIPTGNMNETYGNWTFDMSSSYLQFETLFLNASTLAELAVIGFDPEQNDGSTFQTLNGSLHMSMTPPGVDGSPGSISLWSQCSMQNSSEGEKTWAYAGLSFKPYFVESSVTCTSDACTVLFMKNITGHPVSMYPFIDEFIKASDAGLNDYPTLGDTIHSATEIYLSQPGNVTVPGAGAYCDISSLDTTLFNDRFSYLMNTFYSTGFTHYYGSGINDTSEKVDLFQYDGNSLAMVVANLTREADATFTYTEDVNRYVINWAWLSVFGVLSIILLLIAIVGVLLEMRTVRSDVLNFASSIARHSKYIKLPATDETMSRTEKARLLGDTMVIMQDARPSAAIGKIVLATATEGAERLRPGRQYR